MAIASTDCFERNLAALSEFQPGVAETVKKAVVPESIREATSRDGSPSFLLPNKEGRPSWLGRSSMPSISAPEIFAGLICDGRSVVLPGVLTGLEPILVASRLPPHSTVFVIEEDPVQLKLALHLHDYTDLIADGRIVFVLGGGEKSIQGLSEFFDEHPGYELPIHLLPVPQRTSVQVAELQGQIEAAGQRIARSQTRRVEEQAQRVGRRTYVTHPLTPRVAVLGVDPAPASLEQARRIERAMTQLGWPHALCVPDAPSHCHLEARLAAIRQVDADLVLFVNTTVGMSGLTLPDDLPVASWHLPGSTGVTNRRVEPDKQRVFFASSDRVHEELVSSGVASHQVEHCDVAADTVMFHPIERSDDDRKANDVDVAIIADLPDARPAASDITLTSHVALARAVAEVAQNSVSREWPQNLDPMLSEAERISGTSIREPEVRDRFIGFLKERVAPVMRASAAAEALIGAGFRIGVWGRNWPPVSALAEVLRGGIPQPEALNRLFNTARVVLIAETSLWGVQTALDVLAAGGRVIWYGERKRFECEYHRFAPIMEHFHLSQTTDDLLRQVTALVRAAAGDHPGAVVGLIREEYSVARRLVQISDTIRVRRQRERKLVPVT